MMLIVIALLLLANFARWYFSADRADAPVVQSAYLAADFRLKAAAVPEMLPVAMHRDLFERSAIQVKRVVKETRSPAPIRQALEQEPAQVAPAQDEMSQIKLLGVVVRGGRAQAYLAYGTSTYLVYDQDTVANRFYVARVAVDSVEMLDQKLNIRKTIPLSGR